MSCSRSLMTRKPKSDKITVYDDDYFDNDVTNDLTFNFYRSPHSALTFFGMSAVTSTGNSSSVQFLDVNLGSAIVDNQTNFYYFSVSPKSGTTWSNSMGVVSVVITYEE